MKIFNYVWEKLCQICILYTKYKLQNTKYKLQNTKYNYGDIHVKNTTQQLELKQLFNVKTVGCL